MLWGEAMKEYDVDLTKLYEWLPWGGLVYPSVVRNKDGSLMGFMEAEQKKLTAMDMELPNGWAVWMERQHFSGKSTHIMTLFWNPFADKRTGIVRNSLEGRLLRLEQAEAYFISVLNSFGARIMENEEVLSYLGSVLRGEPFSIGMLKEPLYLDAILSKDVDFRVFGKSTPLKNALSINGRFVTALTPLGYPRMPIMGILFRAFRDFDYRFVRRFIFMDKDTADKELKGYMKNWCRGRQSVKSFLLERLDNAYWGIYTNTFIFQFPEDERKENETYIKEVLETMDLPHIMEDFNRKHAWWAAIPGIHQAGLTSPVKGIGRFADLLLDTEDEYVSD